MARALIAATLLSAYVLLAALPGRSFAIPQYHTSVGAVIAGYYLAAIVGGVAVGGLWHLTPSVAGAFFVGAFAGTLAYGCVALSLGQASPFWLVLFPGIIVGGGLGVVMHSQAYPSTKPHREGRTVLMLVAGGIALIVLTVVIINWMAAN